MENKTEKQLSNYINELESKVDDLESKLYEANNRLDTGGLKWLIHREYEANEELPVPRLQIECKGEGYDWDMEYSLVIQHFLDHYVIIPLGLTSRNGTCSLGDLPLRDGAHIKHDMKTLNLPAYHIVNGESEIISG